MPKGRRVNLANGVKAGELYVAITYDGSEVDRGLGKTRDQVANLGKILASGLIVKGLADIGKAAIKVGIEYESAFAGVKKTVDATESEFQKLSDGIRDMAKTMPMAASEIAGVAEAAGQLGILTPNILDFTKVMSDLGVATNMGAEEAATALARLANITQMNQGDFDKLGSSIVGLGNNFATTESEIVNMSLRLAAAANQAGFSEAEIMGLSTALSSVGVNAEAGGGAMTRVLNKINNEVLSGGRDLGDYAKIAGMTGAEFSKAWGESAPKAFDKFVQGLGEAGKEGKSVSAILKDLGIKETIATTALMSLAGSGDVLTRALEEANTAWEENVALTNEASQRYETLESKIEIMKNGFADMGITIKDALDDSLRGAVDAATGSIDRIGQSLSGGELQGSLNTISQGFEKFISAIAKAAETVIPALINIIAGLTKTADALSPVILGVMAAFMTFKAVTGVIGAVTGAIGAVSAAMKVLGGIAKASATSTALLNPIILGVAAAIGAIVLAVTAYKKSMEAAAGEEATFRDEIKKASAEIIKNTEAVKERQKQIGYDKGGKAFISSVQEQTGALQAYASRLQSLMEVENKSVGQKAQIKAIVDELNSTMPDLNLRYNEEADALNQSIASIGRYIETKKRQAEVDAYNQIYTETIKERIQLEQDAEKAAMNLAAAEERMTAVTNDANLSSGERKAKLKAIEEGYYDAEYAVVAAADALALNESQARLAEVRMENLAYEMGEVASGADEMGTAIGNTSSVFEDVRSAYEQYKDALDDKDLENELKDHAQQVQDWANTAGSAFEKVETKSKTSLKEMAENIAHNNKAVREFVGHYKFLEKEVNSLDATGFLNYLDTLSPEAAAQLAKRTAESLSSEDAGTREAAQKLVKEISDGVQENQALLIEAVDVQKERMADGWLDNQIVIDAATDGTKDVMDAVGQEMESADIGAKAQQFGEDGGEGYARGWRNKEGAAREAAKAVVNAALNQIPKTQNSSSPSKITQGYGGDAGDGYVLGIQSKIAAAGSAAGGLVERAVSTIKSAKAIRAPLEAGNSFSANYADGISKNANHVVAIAKGLAKNISEAFDSARAKEQGRKFVEDWAAGIRASDKLLSDAVRAANKKGIDGVEDMLKKRREKMKISAEEEIAIWKEVAQKSAKYREEAEQKAFDLTKKVFEERKKIIAVSATEEKAFWDNQAKQYSDGTLQRAEAEKNSIATTRDLINERKEMEDIGAKEVVKIWEDTAKKYKEGTASRAEADKELFRARKALLEEEKKLLADALAKERDVVVQGYEKQRDATVSAMEKQLAEIEKGLSRQIEAVKAAASAQTDAVRKQSEARIAQYNREYDARMKLLDAETNAELAALQGKIDALDEMTSLEDEAIRKSEWSERLAELQTKLQTAEGEDRVNIQKQINKMLEEEQRRGLLKQRDHEKKAIRQQMEEVRAAAAERKEMMQIEKENAIEGERAHTEATIAQIKAREEAAVASMQAQLEATKQSNAEQIQATKEMYDKQIQEAKEAYDQQIEEVKNATLKTIDAIDKNASEGLRKLVNKFKSAGTEAGKGFMDSLKAMLASAQQTVSNAVGDALNNSLKNGKSAAAVTKSALAVPMAETMAIEEPSFASFAAGSMNTFASKLIDPNAVLKAENGLYALMEHEAVLASRSSGRGADRSSSGGEQTTEVNPVNVQVYLTLNEARFNDRKMVSQLAGEVSEAIAKKTRRQTRYNT